MFHLPNPLLIGSLLNLLMSPVIGRQLAISVGRAMRVEDTDVKKKISQSVLPRNHLQQYYCNGLKNIQDN